jgi:arginase
MSIDANERVALGHHYSRVPRNRLTWANIRPLVVPLWLGSENPGAEKGARILADELAERWNRPDRVHLEQRLQPPEVIATPVPSDADERLHRQSLEFLPEVETTSRDLADRVHTVIEAGDIPLTLGGDHAIAIGTIAGAARACEKLGVIWFDTHPDINTPSTSPSGHIHGMPIAIAIGEAAGELPSLTGLVDRVPMVAPENVCMLGIRDIDPAEAQRIRDLGIWTLSMDEWSDLGIMEGVRAALQHLRATRVDGIHVSFDVDVLDPTIMPGTGTRWPGGLTVREASRALRELAEWDLPIHSLDWVELNPDLDPAGTSTLVATSLLATCLGERMYM